MTTATYEFPSLITPDAGSGLALASRLAEQLNRHLTASNVERPGGTNYTMPQSVPRELTVSMLYYTIAAANKGWGK